jgi:hypothetical protein
LIIAAPLVLSMEANGVNRCSKFRWTAVWFSTFLLFGAAAFSSFKDLGLPERHFPSASPYYTVTGISEDPQAPGFLQFHLTTPHGPYEVEGLVHLKKTAREIEVLETLDRSELTGMAEVIQDTGEGLKKLIERPEESAADLKAAGKKIGHMIEVALSGENPGEQTSVSELVLGSTKRDLAQEMGVDVYSRNPHLQKRLDELVRARMSGKGAATIARMMLPLGRMVSLTLTAGALNKTADRLAADVNREELFQMNLAALVRAGHSEEDVRALLNHPYWTPREATYFRHYFEKLNGVPGAPELLKRAGRMDGGIRAYQFLHEVQMAAEQFDGNPEHAQIRSFPEGMALKQGGKLFWMTAYDYLDAGDFGKPVILKAENVKSDWGCHLLEILNGGKITLGFSAASFLRGIPAKGMVLFEEGGLPAGDALI